MNLNDYCTSKIKVGYVTNLFAFYKYYFDLNKSKLYALFISKKFQSKVNESFLSMFLIRTFLINDNK